MESAAYNVGVCVRHALEAVCMAAILMGLASMVQTYVMWGAM